MRRTLPRAINVYAPVAIWLGVIFYLSTGGGSATETSRIIGPLIKFFFPDVAPETLQLIHGLVRKAAHVTEYAILAALATRAFLASEVSLLVRNWAAWAILLVAATAAIDEFNQSFNVLRTGSPWDVALDISGGVLAVTIIWLFRRRRAARHGSVPE